MAEMLLPFGFNCRSARLVVAVRGCVRLRRILILSYCSRIRVSFRWHILLFSMCISEFRVRLVGARPLLPRSENERIALRRGDGRGHNTRGRAVLASLQCLLFLHSHDNDSTRA